MAGTEEKIRLLKRIAHRLNEAQITEVILFV